MQQYYSFGFDLGSGDWSVVDGVVREFNTPPSEGILLDAEPVEIEEFLSGFAWAKALHEKRAAEKPVTVQLVLQGGRWHLPGNEARDWSDLFTKAFW